MELSTVPIGVAADAHVYLAQGGPENLAQLHAFLSDTVLLTGVGFEPPVGAADLWGAPRGRTPDPRDGPRVGILFYRAQYTAGNTAYVEALADAIDAAGGVGVPIFATSLRDAPADLLDYLGTLDALVTTVLAAGGTKPATASAGEDDEAWDVRALAALDIPILQGLCLTWDRAVLGLLGRGHDARSTWPPRSRCPSSTAGSSRCRSPSRRPTPTACRTTSPITSGAAGWPRSRSTTPGCGTSRPPSARSRSCCRPIPTKHSRIGNAVGLDTPVSVIRLLRALREAGYDLGEPGDDSRHRRARAGGGRAAGHHRRQRPDPRADRGRRPGPGVADPGAAGRPAGPDPGRDVPALADRAAGRPGRRGHRGLGRGARRAVRGPDRRSPTARSWPPPCRPATW